MLLNIFIYKYFLVSISLKLPNFLFNVKNIFKFSIYLIKSIIIIFHSLISTIKPKTNKILAKFTLVLRNIINFKLIYLESIIYNFSYWIARNVRNLAKILSNKKIKQS